MDQVIHEPMRQFRVGAAAVETWHPPIPAPMKVQRLHPWSVTPKQAVQIQKKLRAMVIARGRVPRPRLVAGADIALDHDTDRVYACVVVLAFPSMQPVETVVAQGRTSFPYVPGLLSFREAPTLLRAFRKLQHIPDVIFVDGHGASHPRAAGLACHIGVLLDRPTIGCAKSVLVGTYTPPAASRGAVSALYDKQGQVIGTTLRTRDGVRPVFVSVGHRIALAQAVRLTLLCGKGYRLPEPTRQADIRAGAAKRGALGAVQGPS